MLKKAWSLATDRVREQFGVPVALSRFLAQHARDLAVRLEPASDALFLGSVPRWHEWGQAGTVRGDAFQAGELSGWSAGRYFGWRSTRVVLPDLASFGSCARTPRWRCDIQDVTGLQASKSELAKYDSLDAMALQGVRSMVSEVSRSRLNALLAHRELRFLRQPKASEHFVRHLWDGRLFLANGAGSPRFAAARYVAGRIGLAVPLCAELHTCSIEPLAVSGLRRGWELFAVSTRDTTLSTGLHEALRRLRAPYLSKPLPPPWAEAQVLFLPREDRRAMAAAVELRAAGLPDVGKHLSALVLRQHMNLARQGEGTQAMAA